LQAIRGSATQEGTKWQVACETSSLRWSLNPNAGAGVEKGGREREQGPLNGKRHGRSGTR